MITPSIGSSDGKTFIKKLSQQNQRTARYYQPSTLPPPARPAQVVIDTVTAFYQEDPLADSSQRGMGASTHNAVIQNMSPAMRRTLKARRIRGGAGTSGLMQRLEIGLYFAAWYALNVIYNSTYVRSVVRRGRFVCFKPTNSILISSDSMRCFGPIFVFLKLSTKRY
jgi:hypothetical protein